MENLLVPAGITALALLAAVLVLSLVVLLMKRQGICPVCLFQKLFCHPARISGTTELPPYENGAARTPPMGWSSWNAFREKIDEQIIRDTAQVMCDAGLREAGYRFVNLDDCWHSSLRDENGRLQGDLTSFPSGIPNLVNDVNAMGMKLGLYSSNGTLTCEDLPASLGRERLDAETVTDWGVEFFKYDYCHNIPISSKAPLIEKITVGRAGAPAGFECLCTDAKRIGLARIMRDKKLPTGHYVTGLDANRGALEFVVPCAQEGEYVLTLCIKKVGVKEKYITVRVNGGEEYDAALPGTVSRSPTGRCQMRIHLNKGENRLLLYNPIGTRADSARIQYTRMGRELRRAAGEKAARTGEPARPVTFSICEWGLNAPWQWGRSAGNLWRTTPDIFPNWISILGIYSFTVGKYRFAGPGHWNDPDMLEVGNGKLSDAQNRAHFTLWCMLAAPLVLGNDLRKLRGENGEIDRENPVLSIITNEKLIAVDQDPLGKPAKRIRHGRIDVLARPLADGSIALCAVNKWGGAGTVRVALSQLQKDGYIGLAGAGSYEAQELWTERRAVLEDSIRIELGRHQANIYKITPRRTGGTGEG